MIQVTPSRFRREQAALLALADKGEQVIIRRRGKGSYMLTPVQNNDSEISPELEEAIEEARKEFREGKTISCKSIEELHQYLDSL